MSNKVIFNCEYNQEGTKTKLMLYLDDQTLVFLLEEERPEIKICECILLDPNDTREAAQVIHDMLMENSIGLVRIDWQDLLGAVGVGIGIRK